MKVYIFFKYTGDYYQTHEIEGVYATQELADAQKTSIFDKVEEHEVQS